jgi:hypothetical protein
MLRRFATGQGLTPDLFMQSAMEQPLSPLATLGESVTTGVLSSPGIGTAIRELYAPDAARKVVTEDLGPASMGRGGTGRRTRTRLGFKTAEEVAAEGDTLFTTPEDYKASPSYRAAIPFEPGMTESRARALADMYDAQQVRDYYGQKRPVLNFVGNVAGSALDPINYIPIVGEAAYAAAAYRIGRIGARAVIGAADAAANTALFGILTADQRAKFGDDVSWNAIAMNAAYAAVAGGVVGAGIGTGAHFFRRTADVPLPEIPEAARTDGVAAPVLPERPAPDLTMGDRVTARFDTEPRATVNVFDRMETAGNRIKAADVMNDAIRGIVDEGEVRLGERSQGHVAAMQADAARIEQRLAAGPVVDAGGPSIVDRGDDAQKSPKPQNVLEFIAANGGLRDDGGELSARGINYRTSMTRNGPWFRKKGEDLGPDMMGGGKRTSGKGRTVEDIRQLLVENGYIDRPTDNNALDQSAADDVYSLIDKQLSGSPVYSARDRGRADEIAATSANEELQARYTPQEMQFIDDFGYDLGSKIVDAYQRNNWESGEWLPEDVYLAADLIERGYEPDDAFARAAYESIYGDMDELSAESKRLVSEYAFSDTEWQEPKQRTSAVASPRNPVLNAVTEEVVPVDRPAADIAPRSLRADALKGPRINTKTNFTVPAPDPVAPMLKPALAKVEARATVAADPEKALIDRIVSDAREEGFDPETGSHELEAEIEAMRAQGVLTPEEDAALKASDETYQAATAWEDVMTVARNCVLPS